MIRESQSQVRTRNSYGLAHYRRDVNVRLKKWRPANRSRRSALHDSAISVTESEEVLVAKIQSDLSMSAHPLVGLRSLAIQESKEITLDFDRFNDGLHYEVCVFDCLFASWSVNVTSCFGNLRISGRTDLRKHTLGETLDIVRVRLFADTS